MTQIIYFLKITRQPLLILRLSSRFSCGILVTFILALVTPSSHANAVGFTWIEKYDLQIGVWYPSEEPETEVRFGPFDAKLAMDAAPDVTGKYQVVLFSHGNLGRARNHYLTAKALARAGFIVIAPLHAADHLMSGDETAVVLDWRVTELRFALEAVMQRDEFRSLLDLSRIHALGYSLGALTALNAAGASFDIPAADRHCATASDPAFCDLPPFYVRWWVNRKRGTKTPTFGRTVEPVHFSLGFVTGGVAAVAPVGQGVGVDANIFTGRRVLVIGLEDDDVTIPEFHAANIAKIFSGIVKTELQIVPGHHSAFIAPFAKRVTDFENIPAAFDPEGFDRLSFLENVNNTLVEFFLNAR